MELTYPWPDKALSPNARLHWSKVSKHKKAQRKAAYVLTLATGIRSIAWEGDIHLWIDFYPPDRRARDQDNMLASCKGLLDGLADALGVDDKRFRLHPFVKSEIGGMVKIRLSPGPDGSIPPPVGANRV
jgi:crossover junction endodeoxyribonuclease RusA